MGIGPNLSGGKYEEERVRMKNPDPDPYKFRVEETQELGNFLIATVHYVGCTNYEGRKILVFRGLSAKALKSLRMLDPHFNENSKLVARFLPTAEGWNMAVVFVSSYNAVLDETKP